MANPNLRLVAPTTVNRTVTPKRLPNTELRAREHLTGDEVERLIEVAKQNRHGTRDALMVLLAYRHGLRAKEVVELRWQIFGLGQQVGGHGPEPLGQARIVAIIRQSRTNVRLTPEVLCKKHR